MKPLKRVSKKESEVSMLSEVPGNSRAVAPAGGYSLCGIDNAVGVCITYDGGGSEWRDGADLVIVDYATVGGKLKLYENNKIVASIAFNRNDKTACAVFLRAAGRSEMSITGARAATTYGSPQGFGIQFVSAGGKTEIEFVPPDGKNDWVEWGFDYTAPPLPLVVRVRRIP